MNDDLRGLSTPCLLLDKAKLVANIDRMRGALRNQSTRLRYHVKTAKCVEVARLVGGGALPIAVSTLEEAEQFFSSGYGDILYAVGVTPAKLDRVLALRRFGADLSVIVDNVEAARAVALASRHSGDPIPTLIEIDCDGTRAGVSSDDLPSIVAMARDIEAGARLEGVLTHCGASYGSRTHDEIRAFAAREREAAMRAAHLLRSAGFACESVSIGSTPTVLYNAGFDGVTEVRAGVFAFFDLVMAGIGVCSKQEIAISVLASVSGVQRSRDRLIIDAGWMALSRDRGTAKQPVDQGYGLVCDAEGVPYPDLIVGEANQEHGIATLRAGSAHRLPDLKLGDLVRILPNHACATAAQHGAYVVLDGGDQAIWQRFRGW
jgi:D-serine deaminase-like pyridoxal phosphate-dependent protein